MVVDYDAVVIGSGLGGLSAGALMARAGKRVLVLERQSSVGGAATTYHRGPLVIEASLHETTPPDAPGDPKLELFEQLNLTSKLRLVKVPVFQEVRWTGLGAPFQLPHGFDAIRVALVARFPDQERQIDSFLTQVRRTLRLPEFASLTHDFQWRMRHALELPLDLWAALRDVRASLSAVFERYFGDNEAIKFALCGNLAYYSDDPREFWWVAFMMAQGSYMQSGGYYIHGGSQQLTNSLCEVIQSSGGVVIAASPATRIDLDLDGRIKAVRYKKEEGLETVALCNTVFGNAAPHVVTDMLPSHVQAAFVERFEKRPLSISLLSATVGLDRPASDFGISSYSTVLIPEWMKRFDDFPRSTELFASNPAGAYPVACVVDYGQIDSGLRDRGLYPVNIVCPDRLANWDGLDDSSYHARRTAWLEALIAQLDAEWPGIASAVKARTISTARTMHAHLNTPGGAIYGFAMVPPTQIPRKRPIDPTTTIPGLWIASAYTGFGGFTGAIGGGIAAAKAALSAGGSTSNKTL